MNIHQVLGTIRLVGYVTSLIVLASVILFVVKAVRRDRGLLTENIKAILVLLLGMCLHFAVSISFALSTFIHGMSLDATIVVQVWSTLVVVVLTPTTIYLWYVLRFYRNGIDKKRGGAI